MSIPRKLVLMDYLMVWVILCLIAAVFSFAVFEFRFMAGLAVLAVPVTLGMRKLDMLDDYDPKNRPEDE